MATSNAMEKCLFALLIAAVIFDGAFAGPELVITKAEREINVQSQSARFEVGLKMENVGNEPANTVQFLIPSQLVHNVAYFKAFIQEGKGKSKSAVLLKSTSTPLAGTAELKDLSIYEITLPNSLKRGGKAITLQVLYILTHVFTPFPAEIAQGEPQLLLFHDSHYLLSPYPVKYQITVVRFPTPKVESFTKKEPSKKSQSLITFGPYENVKPVETSPLTVHFEHDRPMVFAERLDKEIEISHWGNVYVTEKYFVRNNGAKHKGGFSRLDFQMGGGRNTPSAVRGLVGQLPPNAHSIYYRDEIGNISTSAVRKNFKATELHMEPRYPLLGGWSVEYTIGYSLPLTDAVSLAGKGTKKTSPVTGRALALQIGSPFAELVVDELIVKVVLPEGSKNPSAWLSYPFNLSHEVKYSYLDTVGRPVVVLRVNNVPAEISTDQFQVYYEFSPVLLLGKPLLLVFAFFLFFAVYILYVRSDLAIYRGSEEYLTRLAQEKVVYAVQRLVQVVSQRGAVLSRLDQSLAVLLRSGDLEKAKSMRRTAEAALKDSAKDLKLITDQLEAEASGKQANILPIVVALVAKDKLRSAQMLLKHTTVVELVEKKAVSSEIEQKVVAIQEKSLKLQKETLELLAQLSAV